MDMLRRRRRLGHVARVSSDVMVAHAVSGGVGERRRRSGGREGNARERGNMEVLSLVEDTTAGHADHTCMIREAMFAAEKSSSMWLGSG